MDDKNCPLLKLWCSAILNCGYLRVMTIVLSSLCRCMTMVRRLARVFFLDNLRTAAWGSVKVMADLFISRTLLLKPARVIFLLLPCLSGTSCCRDLFVLATCQVNKDNPFPIRTHCLNSSGHQIETKKYHHRIPWYTTHKFFLYNLRCCSFQFHQFNLNEMVKKNLTCRTSN